MNVAILKALLRYDPKTGSFRWLVSPRYNVLVGQVAGHVRASYGYRVIGIQGNLYRAHRLAFLYMTGSWPLRDIDHIDGNKDNNKWANLRDADQRINQGNRKRANANSGSGLLGVGRWRVYWRARITVNRKEVHLGYFKNKHKAYAAYLLAKRQLHAGCTI